MSAVKSQRAMQITKRKPETIDEYLARANPDQRTALNKLRRIIRTVATRSTGVHQLRNSCVSPHWTFIGFFGAWRNHCAFYLGSSKTLKKFQDELRNFQTSKGTLRFSPDKPLPVALVKKLVKTRIAENNDRANKKRRKS